MTKRLKHVSVWQAARVLAVVYAILAIPLALLGLVGLFLGPQSHELSPWLFAFLPVFYGTAVFVFGWCSAVAYNFVARWLGGIQVTFDD